MVRKMERGDIPEIMRLWIEGNLDAHDFVGGDYWRRNYAHVQSEIARSEVYVYPLKDEMLGGFIGLKGDYVAGLFVDREKRGCGIGKALLDFAKKKHSALSLHVFEKNRRALKFYIREGFSVSKEAAGDMWEKELLLSWEKLIIV